MKILSLISFLLFSSSIFSQQLPQPYWQKALGGYGDDWAVGFVRTFDKGYAILSSNYQSLNGDIDDNNVSYDAYCWIVRLDADRNIVWQNKIHDRIYPTLGGSPTGIDIIQTKDSGIVVIGQSAVYASDPSTCWAIKYDKDGHFLWKYEHPNTGVIQGFKQVLENPDGSLLICGYNTQYRFSSYQGWLLCLQPNGQLKWQKSYHSTNPTADRNLIFETIDTSFGGGYIVGGSYDSTNSFGNASSDLYIAKLTTDGNMTWFRTYGGKGIDVATDILPLPDKTYMIAGSSTSLDGDVGINHCYGDCQPDVWLLKIDQGGTILTKQVYGDFDTERAVDMSLYKNGVYIVGYSNSYLNGFAGNKGKYDIWGLQLDYSLNRISEHSFYGGPKNDRGINILIDSTDNEIFPVILSTTESESGGQVEGFHNSTALNEKDIWIFKLGYFNTIKGYAFYDYNKNGKKETTEPFYKRGVFTTKGDTDTISSYNITGDYIFKVLGFEYTTQFQTNDTAFTIVPASKKSTFSNFFNTDSINFALQLRPGFTDVSIAAYPLTPSRPGFETTYEAMLTNRSGDTVSNRQLYMLKDPLLTFKNATPTPSKVTADSVIWQYTGLKPADTIRFTVKLLVASPPTAQIGDTIRSYFLAPLPNDADTTDNSASLIQTIRGSFDPNDKNENHNGKLDAAKAAKGEFLSYMIRFQNTGNDTAFTVVVRDTLDKSLDIESLEILKASHAYTVAIKNNSIQWTFFKINLPDSTSNEPASHGYIIYRVRTNSNPVPNSSVHNKASIYFDFNLPIITNTSSTLLWSATTGVPDIPSTRTSLVSFYPNPVSNFIWLRYSGNTVLKTKLYLYDNIGRQVATLPDQELRPSSSLMINLPSLSKGIYFLKLSGNNINEGHKIVVVQ